ncbi:MAG: Tc toxin subunit A, partial [Bacteroidia bacterium]
MPNTITHQPTLDAFINRNASINFSTHNLFDRVQLDQLNWADANQNSLMAEIMAYQRLLRLTNNDSAAAGMYYALDFLSAQQIASFTPTTFIAEFRKRLAAKQTLNYTVTDEQLNAVFATASGIAQKAALLAAHAHNTTAPYTKNQRINATSPKLIQEFESLTGYQEIFGATQTCACDACKSIFGPSAYYVDLMRLVDKHITQKNTIANGYRLLDRRPDLLKIPLTCENTTTEIPYIQLVNEVLENCVNSKLQITNTYRELANKTYPLALPYHQPLDQA